MPLRSLLSAVVIAGALALPVHEAAAQSEPLRLGFLTVRTGALAAGGRQMEEGIQLFLKERNYTLAGRRVELIIADTGGNPAQAKTKTQELIERNHVHVIIGPLATFEALAIDDYIQQAQVPLITPTSAAQKDLAQQKLSDYVIHAVGTAAQPMHVLGEYAAKKLGIKRVATIADDFTYGHEGTAGFQQRVRGQRRQGRAEAVAAAQRRRLRRLRRPDQDQRGRRLRRVRRHQRPALPQAVRGIRAQEDPGVRQPDLRRRRRPAQHGRRGARRVLGELVLGRARHAGQQALRPGDAQAEYKVIPGFYTAGTYVAGTVSRSRARGGQGQIRGQGRVRARTAQRAPRAAARWDRSGIDEYGKPVLNIYIRKVERKDGRLVNTIVETFPEVTQFWNYDPKQFLAAPVYSRDFPPAKNLE